MVISFPQTCPNSPTLFQRAKKKRDKHELHILDPRLRHSPLWPQSVFQPRHWNQSSLNTSSAAACQLGKAASF